MEAPFQSLRDDLVRHVLAYVPQRDAVALCSTSRNFDACYPAHVTRVFSADATEAEYTAMCEWIVSRRVTSFTLAVDATLWNATAPKTLAGVRFDRVTLAPNEVVRRSMVSTPWTPACDSFVCGFVTDSRLALSVHLEKTRRRGFATMWVRNLSTTGPAHLPHFPEVPGVDTFDIISCSGHVDGIERLPLGASIVVEQSPLCQVDIDHLARVVGKFVVIRRCTIDASVQPRAFAASELQVTLDALRVVAESACTTFTLELNGAEAYPECVPHFPRLETVIISGYCYNRRQAVRLGALFPHARKKYVFKLFDHAV